MRYLSSLAAVWVLALAGCALFAGGDAGLKLSGDQKDKMAQKYVGREYVLGSSLYAADFFGDSGKWFVDARPFDIIKLYRHTGEETAVPAQRSEIIPAGTPVRVAAFEYPVEALTASLNDRADLALAPTGHTWLSVLRTDEPNAKALVFVLPKDIATEEQFTEEVQKRLASPQSMTALLAHSDPTHLASVFEKKVVNGMSRAAMFAALGEPKNAAQQAELGTLEFVADYGDLQITVQGNVVSKVVSLREQAELTRQAAEEAAQNARAEAEAKRKQDEIERAALAEIEKQKAADAEAARQAREALSAKEQAEQAKKQAVLDADAQRKAELQARLDAAQAKKEEAERERVRRIEDAKASAELARAEAEAKKAQRLAEADAARAEAEAARTQQKLAAEVARAEAEASAARRRADEAKRVAAASSKGSSASTAPAAAPVVVAKAEPVAPPPPRKIGVRLTALTKEKAFDLKYTSLEGALVVSTTPAGAAAIAGLLADDIVTAIDGKAVGSPEALTDVVSGSPWEKVLVLSVWRAGQKKTVVVAGAKPPAPVATAQPAQSRSAQASSQPVPAAKSQQNKSMLPSRRSNEKGSDDPASLGGL